MADIKISALPAGVADPNGIVPVVNGTTTQRVRVGDIVALAGTIVGPEGPQGPVGPAGESIEFAVQTTPPANPRTGDLWLDDNQALNIWDGSQWIPVTSAASGTANIVSITEPAAGTVEGELWIDPDGDEADNFSNAGLPTSIDPPVTEQISGEPLGFQNGVYYEPDVIGGVPVVVAGKRYLLPLLEAPASAAGRQALFNFVDQMVTSQKDGTFIGTMPNGAYSLPDYVGGVRVSVGGQNYLIPLMQE